MDPTNPERNQQKHGKGLRYWIWPAIVILFLGSHFLLWVVFAARAMRDPSFAVEPDYYRKSLEWDTTQAQLQTNRVLGWSVDIDVDTEAEILGDRGLRCRITDLEGTPVPRAQVELVAFPHARAGQRVNVKLAEGEPGHYAAKIRMRRPGLWEFRVKARRGDQKFTYVGYQEVGSRTRGATWQR